MLSEITRRISHEDKISLESSYPEAEAETDGPKALRFKRAMRQKGKNCPLCTYVQGEIAKGLDIPIEEWIYLAHLESAHGIIA